MKAASENESTHVAPDSMSVASSAVIASKAQSNLAFALITLPKERRDDMITFYAFCRVVDDIADEPSVPIEQKRAELAAWRGAVLGSDLDAVANHALLSQVLALPGKYHFSPELLAEIIDGVASDQDKTRHATIDDLLAYCYKVASVVGIVSAHIFGATHPQSREYAIALGYALQLTNITRDVGEDARESGRIYLPQDELMRFGVSEEDILQGRYSENFTRLMQFQHDRARRYFDEAEQLLPAQDRSCMIAARMMGAIYAAILEKIRRGGFRVLEQHTRLSKWHKGAILIGYWARGWLGC